MTQKYLQQIPEQTAYITVYGRMFNFHFYTFRGLVYVDIKRDTNYVVSGKRVLPNVWLLPRSIAVGYGNVRFETYAADGDDYVWYDGFNKKFRLMVYSDEEIEELEAQKRSSEG